MDSYKVFQSRSTIEYDLSIYQFGYEKCTPDQEFSSVRDCFILHFIVSGKGLYNVRNKTFNLRKGDCFLLIPDEETHYEADSEDPYEYFWIGFRGVNAKRIMENIGFYENDNFVYHSNEQEYEILYRYMSGIMLGDEINDKNYIHALGSLYLILSLLTRKGNPVCSIVKMDSDVWMHVVEFIACNYEKDISVEGIASHFGFHRTSIYKLFKRNANMSPNTYILNYRLDKAMNMVKTTNILFKQIAADCGFDNLSYFYKAFKKKFGRTPKQIRQLD